MTSTKPIIQLATLDDHEAVAHLHFLSHTVSFAPFVSAQWLDSTRLEDYVSKWRETLGNSGQWRIYSDRTNTRRSGWHGAGRPVRWPGI